ncbi:MAG: RNA methyltransferase, partial [Candidatus Cryptobacteroides sp.]|nr:RNA methyltransferase [Candidatus Cryptobacteroides sp.]
MKTEKITSARNERIRQVLELQEKSRTRRALGLFVVEGRRELEHCLEAGYELDSVFWCPEIL